MVSIEVSSDKRRRSVSTVSRTEGVVDIDVSKSSELLSEFLLAFLDRLLSCSLLFVRSIFGQTTGLAFFFSVEAEVLEKESLAGLEVSSELTSFFAYAVGSELDIDAKTLRHVSEDVAERELILDLLRTAKVRADDDRATVSEDLLEGRESSADTRVVGDVEVCVEGHVEVHTDESLLTSEVELINRHRVIELIIHYLNCLQMYVIMSTYGYYRYLCDSIYNALRV